MAPLMSANRLPVRNDRSLSVNEWLEKSGIPIGESSRTDRLNEIIHSVLSGDSTLLLGGVTTRQSDRQPAGRQTRHHLRRKAVCPIAQAVFSQFYHSPEDYYERFLIGTLIRLIRVLSMIMALLLPSLCIAFSSFHPEMIPSRLVIAMAAHKLQKQYKTDALGIGSYIKAYHPTEWNRMDWKRQFPEADIHIGYIVKLRNTGIELH